MSQVCTWTQDEQDTPVSNELLEPRLTVLVSVGPKMTQILTPDFKRDEIIKIRGKITVSF